MGKLHEVLAVEGDLSATSTKIIEEATATFSKKPTHFLEEVTAITYFDDSQSQLNTTESTAMTTTVADKLEYVVGPIGRYFDAYLVKETTNQTAKADIIVDGVAIFTDVPATVLLGMEKKLKDIRDMYEAIPTLQPGVKWEPDPNRAGNVYAAQEPDVRFITKRVLRPFELSPATPQHKAQVQAIEEDVPVAKKTITKFSGMLSPGEKSDLLERTDKLIRAVKKARQRANDTTAVDSREFGKAIFDFINGDTI